MFGPVVRPAHTMSRHPVGGPALLDGVPELLRSEVVAMLVGGPDGEILDANDALLDLIGYSRVDLEAGRIDWKAITPPEFVARAEEAIAELLATGNAPPYEKEYIRKDGRRVPVLVGLALIQEDPFQAIGYVVDQSERHAETEERARLLRLEHEARATAEAALRRLRFLLDASATLASSLDHQETVARLAALAVPRLADWCSVELLRDDTVEPVAIAHVDPSKVDLVWRLRRQHRPDPLATRGVSRVIRTGEPELLERIPADAIEEMVRRAPENRAVLEELVPTSSMIVPLVARGGTIGAMTFVWAGSGNHYEEADLQLAEDLARRAAMAIENARLYGERNRVAEILQRSLLPADIPSIRGLAIGARYRPAGDGTQVGGDFYDVFETGDEQWALVVGDVCGKGAPAAAVMALARYTVRTVALSDTRPSAILRTLNEALLRDLGTDRFCTACHVRMKRHENGWRLTISCGGHPLPLVLRADGTLETVGVPGTLLGYFPDPELSDRTVDLELGDTLIVYTDGVTDERRGRQEFGERRLQEVIRSAAGRDSQELADAIEREVVTFRRGDTMDDIAILAVEVTR